MIIFTPPLLSPKWSFSFSQIVTFLLSPSFSYIKNKIFKWKEIYTYIHTHTYTGLAILSLTYFAYYDDFQFRPFSSKWHDFILFYLLLYVKTLLLCSKQLNNCCFPAMLSRNTEDIQASASMFFPTGIHWKLSVAIGDRKGEWVIYHFLKWTVCGVWAAHISWLSLCGQRPLIFFFFSSQYVRQQTSLLTVNSTDACNWVHH